VYMAYAANEEGAPAVRRLNDDEAATMTHQSITCHQSAHGIAHE